MAPNLLFYQLLLTALVFICLLIHVWCPDASCHPSNLSLTPDKPRRKRSQEPKPFTGLIHKPLCEACEQRADGRPKAPGSPPPVITFTRGRRRTVDTRAHFCPAPDCSYHGWLGRGNIRANGLPTICQPQFVKFSPHLHDRLTTNPAGIIACAMTQHGHQDTQQSTANVA